MEFSIIEITEQNKKSSICNTILRSLPSWFGIESSIVDYVEKVRTMPFYAAFDNNKVIGFVAIKIHNCFTVEVCVMGILENYHRRGLGKKLIESCEMYCVTTNKEFLTVKTLDGSVFYEPYEKTRLFYEKMGFKPLEVFPLHWDKNNPCLFLAKYVATS